jgi:hypothetical protein
MGRRGNCHANLRDIGRGLTLQCSDRETALSSLPRVRSTGFED